MDECFNDRRLADACNSEGRCKVLRYPRRLKQQQDPSMLPELLAKEAPLLTTDFTIVEDNAEFIPEPNSGVIVVRSRFPHRPFTSKMAAANLGRLKERFPVWPDIDWSGIYLEIDEEEVLIDTLTRGARKSIVIPLNAKDFAKHLSEKLDFAKPRPIRGKKDVSVRMTFALCL